MAAYYFDTSGLAKRYIEETGSLWIRQLTDISAGNESYTVSLAGPELVAVAARRGRAQPQQGSWLTRTLANIRLDWRSVFTIVEADGHVVQLAMDVAKRHALRGYDAVHLAAAMILRDLRTAEGLPAIVFVSADQEQLQAAMREGFTVEDPNRYG